MNLRIPGPIPVDKQILQAMAAPMINHRGREFKEILYRTTEGLKQVFDTEEDVYILTSSGTGAMEAAIVNTLSPGDKVINATIGIFGERFGLIAQRYGAEVISCSAPYGNAIEPEQLRKALKANPEVKAVLVTHNETSTGVTNDLEVLANIVKAEFDKLILVDGISSVCSIPIHTDDWGLDVVASASQKGWMLPPGLAFISFSKKAWEANARAEMPRFYFDLSQYSTYFEIGQPPYTPSLSCMFALDLALERIKAEGLARVFERHAEIGSLTREGIHKLGLSLFPHQTVASDTVTAISVPTSVNAAQLLQDLRQDHNVVLAGGQQSLSGKIIRIGHMGFCTEDEIQETLLAIKAALLKQNFQTPP